MKEATKNCPIDEVFSIGSLAMHEFYRREQSGAVVLMEQAKELNKEPIAALLKSIGVSLDGTGCITPLQQARLGNAVNHLIAEFAAGSKEAGAFIDQQK